MRIALGFLLSVLALVWGLPVHAESGCLTYRARVVHENRSQLSFVNGGIDLASGDFRETVEHSYRLDWRRMPGGMIETRPALPDIWRVADHTAQRFGSAMPRFDSPILRHFIVGQIIARGDTLAVGDSFLAGQLEIGSVDFDQPAFEVVAAYRGMPLVLVGHRERVGGHQLVRDLAVLGPASELYQYFFDEIEYDARPLTETPQLPVLNPDDYITFPAAGAQPVAIRPIKDWLVFQAQLPNGRPLNLVLDSGAETMILDELVLKVDALLEPVGQIRVAGAFGSDKMNLYEDFSFEVGGVSFDNLQVAGTQLTSLAMGAGLRIHGIVGSEILQLTRLDINLTEGQMLLSQPGEPFTGADANLPLTFIGRLPHVQVELHGTQSALMMLDTGQRSGLAVNLDWLDHYGMDDQLMLNGFLGDINGGLAPRYIVENLDLDLAGQTYHENAADASPEATFSYNGMPVIGAIGFPLLARHYANLSFDYSNKLLHLGEPATDRKFTGRPEAWDTPVIGGPLLLAGKDDDDAAVPDEDADYNYAVAAVISGDSDPRRPKLLNTDPAAKAAEPGFAWVDENGKLVDALAMVRNAQPELAFTGPSYQGWQAVDDPRHRPVVLPELTAADQVMHTGNPALTVAADQAFAEAARAVELRLLANAVYRLFGIHSDALSLPVAPVEPPAATPAEDAGDLGSTDKPDDYPFKRGLPRLKFD